MAINSPNKLTTNTDDQTPNGWENMGGENLPPTDGWSILEVTPEEELAEKESEPELPKWEELTDEEKKKRAGSDLFNFIMDNSRIGDAWRYDGIFKNAPLGYDESYESYRKRVRDEIHTNLDNGRGYVDIAKLKKDAARCGIEELKVEAAQIIEHLKEVDINHGLSPLQRILKSIKEKK